MYIVLIGFKKYFCGGNDSGGCMLLLRLTKLHIANFILKIAQSSSVKLFTRKQSFQNLRWRVDMCTAEADVAISGQAF